MSTRKLIRGGCLLTLDPRQPDLAQGDLLVESDRIAALAPRIDADDAELIDASNCIVIPGFVDAHRHSWQTTIRNLNSDMTFMEYVTQLNPRFSQAHRPEHKHIGVLVGLLEALDAGVTTIVEYGIGIESPEDSDAVVQAMRDAGVRGVYAHGVPSDWQTWWVNSDLRHPRDAERVAREHFSAREGLIGFAMALRGPERTTRAANHDDFAYARSLGARITLHIDEPGAIASMRDDLADDTCYIHCCRSTDEDLDLIRDSGGHVNVTVECEMGLHNAPVTQRLLARGMKPSLGVDGGGTISGDLITQMRLTLQELRMRLLADAWARGGPLWKFPVTTRDALEWATLEGARHFGLDSRIGSLTPGKQADIVLIRHDSLHMSPMNHPVAAVVQSAGRQDVDTVLVAGQVRKRHGKLVGVDVERLRREIYAARDHLYGAVGVPDFTPVVPPVRLQPV